MVSSSLSGKRSGSRPQPKSSSWPDLHRKSRTKGSSVRFLLAQGMSSSRAAACPHAMIVTCNGGYWWKSEALDVWRNIGKDCVPQVCVPYRFGCPIPADPVSPGSAGVSHVSFFAIPTRNASWSGWKSSRPWKIGNETRWCCDSGASRFLRQAEARAHCAVRSFWWASFDDYFACHRRASWYSPIPDNCPCYAPKWIIEDFPGHGW